MFCRGYREDAKKVEVDVNIIIKNFISLMKQRHVVPHPEGWASRKNGSERVSAIFDTQKEAIQYSTKIAQEEHSELFVHKKNGEFGYRNSFGNDPYPPKG